MATNEDVTVSVVFPEPLTINVNFNLVITTSPPPPPAAVSTRFMIGAHPMASASLSVDAVNANVQLQFVDDKGDVTTAPSGVTVAFTSSDEAVATIANDGSNPLQGDLTLLTAGQTTVTATPSGATDPSGNPFAAATVVLTVDPGAAVGDQIVVNS